MTISKCHSTAFSEKIEGVGGSSHSQSTNLRHVHALRPGQHPEHRRGLFADRIAESASLREILHPNHQRIGRRVGTSRHTRVRPCPVHSTYRHRRSEMKIPPQNWTPFPPNSVPIHHTKRVFLASPSEFYSDMFRISLLRGCPKMTSASDIRRPDPSPPPTCQPLDQKWPHTLGFEPRPPILGRQLFPTHPPSTHWLTLFLDGP